MVDLTNWGLLREHVQRSLRFTAVSQISLQKIHVHCLCMVALLACCLSSVVELFNLELGQTLPGKVTFGSIGTYVSNELTVGH